MKSFCILFIACLFFYNSFAQRTKSSFNSEWNFLNVADTFNSDASNWEAISIPHTWNLDAYEKKEYHRGTSWYKKTFTISNDLQSKEIYLRFDAVNSYAEIFLNGKYIASHSGGYSAFNVHLPKNKLEKTNTIIIKVDNRNINIPPLSGDFTIFGGIYRNVWLITVPSRHFSLDNYGSEGIFISTPVVNRKEAEIKIKGSIANADKNSIILVDIKKDGKKIATKKIPATSTWLINPLKIDHPKLWSPDSPHLYTATISLIEKNKTIDQIEIPFGIRWFSADTKNGFLLNGRPLKLMGTNRHQDQKPYGIAVPSWVHKKDMQLIKDMGANFVRLAHYQQDDEVLRLCDSLGLIVWEETPVVDIIADNEIFSLNAKTQLIEMIRQHYNHPSVFFWGYMNEVIIQVQYRIEKEKQDAFYQKTVALAKELEQLLKAEDKTRLSVMAYHGTKLYNDIGLSNIADVSGWNLYQGWYGDELEGFEKFVDEQHKLYPHKPIIISEFGAGSDARLHSLHPETFDFSIEYQQKYLEHYLPQIAKRPFIIGATEWNFIDFNVASRQESMPRTNNKGLVYNNRNPKDVYYYFQSFLRKDKPIIHIAARDKSINNIVTDDTIAEAPVKIYSNADEVQLKVNGILYPKKSTNNFKASWDVAFSQGTCSLFAYAFKNNSIIATDSFTLFNNFTPNSLKNNKQKIWELAINIGSNCDFYDAGSNLFWNADKPYTPGSWGYIDGTVFRKSPGRIGTTAEITNTSHTPLFQTKRENLTTYRIDAAPGEYVLELGFADLYNAPAANAYNLQLETETNDGINSFDIYINDSLVRSNFSPYRSKGNNTAITETIKFYNNSERILLSFKKIKGHSFLNGLKLRREGD